MISRYISSPKDGGGPLNSLKLIENTEYLLSGTVNSTLNLIHTDGEIINFAKEHMGAINSIDIIDSTIVSGGDFDKIILWDLITQRKLNKLTTDPSGINNNNIMTVKLYANLIISSGSNCQINFHDSRLKNTKPIWILKDPSDTVTTLDYAHDRNYLIAGSMDGNAYTYDLRKCNVYIDKINTNQGIFNACSLEDEVLFTNKNSLTISSIDDMKQQLTIPNGDIDYHMNSLLFSLNNTKYIATGSKEGLVKLYKKKSHNQYNILSNLKNALGTNSIINSIQFCHMTHRIYGASWDGNIYYWDNFSSSL